jgi:hypothetical protein
MSEVGAAERSISQDKAQGSVQRDSQTLSFLSRLWVRLSPLLPLLFVIGWFLCRDFFDDDGRFLFTSMLATLTTAVLVFILRRPIESAFPLVIVFGIFVVGYYLKFYWLVLTLDVGDVQGALKFLEFVIQPFLFRENLLRAFELSTWGYVSFCSGAIVAVWLGLAPRSLRRIRSPESSSMALSKAKVLSVVYVVVAVGFWLLTSLVIHKLGLGIHGRENVRLPYNLTGIIHYIHALVVPSLLILVIAWSDRKDMQIYWWAGLLGMVAYGIGVMFLEASRGALVSAVVIPVGTLWVLYGRFTRKRVMFLVILFLAVTLLRPIFTAYRYLRVEPLHNAGFIELITRAYQIARSARTVETPLTDRWFLDRFMTIALRVIGVDSVLYLAPIESVKVDLSWITSVLLGQENFTQKFTQDIVGYGPNVVVQFTAPSLVGGLYFLSGVVGIGVGVFAMALISQWMWIRSCRSWWRTAPLALTQIAAITFHIGSDGAFESLLRDVFVTVVVIVALEFASRVKLCRGAH